MAETKERNNRHHLSSLGLQLLQSSMSSPLPPDDAAPIVDTMIRTMVREGNDYLTIRNEVQRTLAPEPLTNHHKLLIKQIVAELQRIPGPLPNAVPALNIVMLVVGTRGDVQPFCAVALRFRDLYGHRVRIASHAVYRDFVESMNLEFYPLNGDPKVLSSFMVKTKGKLIPDSFEMAKLMLEQPAMLANIIRSTWPAVSQPDPEHPDVPFCADAILANPPSFGHFHCAEALGVPLHIMFPQPWSPTRAFPHPLACMSYEDPPSDKNWLSYVIMDRLTWTPIADAINHWRKKVLRIPAIRTGEHAATLIADMKVPMSFMWSPLLCPKPTDWGNHLHVLGNIFLDSGNTGGSNYVPSPALSAFLFGSGNGTTPPPPIFVGFGSMVIDDPTDLTNMIIEAAVASDTRVLVQSAWSSMSSSDATPPPDNVFFLGRAPHDWLLPRMSAVIHHGGAGTTAAGIRCGKPTMIVPFAGDQYFWGHRVAASGIGLPPCPIDEISAAILTEAFVQLAAQDSDIRTNAEAMALKWKQGERNGVMDVARSAVEHAKETHSPCVYGHPDDGITNATSSFHSQLPLEKMCCDVTECMIEHRMVEQGIQDRADLGVAGRPKVARWVHVTRGLKVCNEVLRTLTTKDENGACQTNFSEWLKWQPVSWAGRVSNSSAVSSVTDGLVRGAGVFLHETTEGLIDMVRMPVETVMQGGTLLEGTAKGLGNAAIHTFHGTAALVDSIASGVHTAYSGEVQPSRYRETVRPMMEKAWGDMRETVGGKPRKNTIGEIRPTKETVYGSGSCDNRNEILSIFATYFLKK
jgi:UDP:flavonoid glycosyltransferase YjiC (YdhE family)